MNELANQTPSELLTLLVDGELQDSQAETLYASLSQNPELRTELQELLAIRDSVMKDTEAFIPPVEAKENIFTALGLTIPGSAAHAPTAVATGVSAVAVSILRKIWVPLAIAVLSSLFTTYFVSNYYNSKNSDNHNSAPVISSVENSETNSPANPAAPPINGGVPALAQNPGRHSNHSMMPLGRSNSIPAAAIDNETAPDAVQNTAPDMNLPTTEESQPGSVAIASIDNSPSEFNHYINKLEINPSKPQGINNSSSYSFLSPTVRAGNKSYMFQVNGNFAQSLQGTGSAFIAPGVNLGFYLLNSRNFQLGFLVGREAIGLQILSDQPGQFENDPNTPVTWAGIGLRYELNDLEILNLVHPFGQVIVGGSEYGMIGKGIAGFQYDFNNSFGLNIGLEYSLINYSYQLQNRLTNKIGVTGGLQFKL